MENISYNQILEATEYIRKKIKNIPQIAIILGSGLGDITDTMQEKIEIKYDDIPNFPISTVKGHDGKLVIGEIDNKTVIAMKGRIHFYEGYTMQQVTFPIRVFKLLGIEKILIISATGAVNKEYHVGDLVILDDYIKLTNNSPLLGPNLEEFGTRFPNMNGNKELNSVLEKVFEKNEIKIQKGVYAFMAGPQYETKAEVNMLRILGADVVGMSTVPEIIVAKHSNMEVATICYVTNAIDDGEILSHENVLKASEKAKDKLSKVLLDFINEI